MGMYFINDNSKELNIELQKRLKEVNGLVDKNNESLGTAIKTTNEYSKKLSEGTEKIELQYAKKLNTLDSQLSDKVQKSKDVIIVAKEGGDYNTINEAIKNAKDTPSTHVTIKVAPGIYDEVVHVEPWRHISLIGENRDYCIIKNDTGEYVNAPLMAANEGLYKNLTIIATHNLNSKTPVDQLRAYACHCDETGGASSTTVFENCRFVSHQNAGFGCGLHQDQKIILRNCEITSKCPSESSMIKNGALFIHNNLKSGVINQNIKVENCTIISEFETSMYLNDANFTDGDKQGNEMTALFLNNTFWVNTNNSPIIKTDTQNIKIDYKSDGNNNSFLNNNIIPWIEPSLGEGLTNYNTIFGNVRYKKEIDGVVRVEGVVGNTSKDKVVFTLPEGYRPSVWLIKTCTTSENDVVSMCNVMIAPDGRILFSDGTKTQYVALSFSFNSEQ